MMRTFLTTVSALVLAGGVSLAADAPPDDEPPARRAVNFEADDLSIDRLKPGTDLIEGVSRGRRSSLIEVRLDFVAELIRSADDI